MAKVYILPKEAKSFIQYLTTKKKPVAENTALAYIQDLSYLFEFVKASPLTITEEQIEEYLNQSPSCSTFCRRRSTYSKFFWWMRVKAKLRFDDPIENIEIPEKDDSVTLKHLTVEQMSSIKQVAINDNISHNRLRNIAIASTLMGCLLRESELRKLNLEDIDFEMGVMYIKKSKRDKSRKFPIPDSVLADIKNYIENERKSHPHALFTSRDGTRVCRTTVVNVMKAFYEEVGCEELSLHATRHGGVTAMLMGGKSIAYVSRLAGHSNPAITLKYFGLIDKDLIDNRMELF